MSSQFEIFMYYVDLVAVLGKALMIRWIATLNICSCNVIEKE